MGGASGRHPVLVAVGEPGQHVRAGGSARQRAEPALLPRRIGRTVQDIRVELRHKSSRVEAAVGFGELGGEHEALRHLVGREALVQLARPQRKPRAVRRTVERGLVEPGRLGIVLAAGGGNVCRWFSRLSENARRASPRDVALV